MPQWRGILIIVCTNYMDVQVKQGYLSIYSKTTVVLSTGTSNGNPRIGRFNHEQHVI